jgi:hypothetical protein
MLSGGVLPLKTGLRQLAYLAPARWGFAATASTVDLNKISPPGIKTDSSWAHTPGAWLTAMGMQLLLAAVFVVIAWWWLVRTSPGHARRPANPPAAAAVPASPPPARLAGRR